MRFRKLFSIQIKHNYFEGSVCDDLIIEPTEGCKRLLRNYKLLFKGISEDVISVYAEVNDVDKLVVEPLEPVLLDFNIFLNNLDFTSFSKLPAKQAGEVYFFSSKNIDKKSGALVISSTKKQGKKISEKPLFGQIQIELDGSVAPTYNLNFEAVEVKWKYYLLTGKNLKNPAINGTLAGIDFSKSNDSDKNKTDKITRALNIQYPQANVFVFESLSSIPYIKNGRKDIQLVNADKNNVLINDLPNPSFNQNGIMIINIIN